MFMTRAPSPSKSPLWSPTTKLVVGLTLVALAAGMLIVFRRYIAPLTVALVLAYLLYPPCRWVHTHLRLSWRTTVGLVYLSFIALLVLIMVLLGLALVQQIQSLYQVLLRFFMQEVPRVAQNLSTSVYYLGPFRLDLTQYDWNALSQELLSSVQPLLGQVGVAVSVVATRTLALLGWLAFILLISYFLLAESSQGSMSWIPLNLLPHYGQELQRLMEELGRIWHTFLRGQFTAFLVMSVLASIVLTSLGVRYSLGLALLVGAARFLPYIGPMVVYIVISLVVLLQPTNFWALEPWKHALISIGVLVIIDQIYDNLVMPRFFGRVLGVHPAAVLLAAIMLTQLIGIIGFMLAAPVVASGKVILRYVVFKMFDLDPWQPPEALVETQPPQPWWRRTWERVKAQAEGWRRELSSSARGKEGGDL